MLGDASLSMKSASKREALSSQERAFVSTYNAFLVRTACKREVYKEQFCSGLWTKEFVKCIMCDTGSTVTADEGQTIGEPVYSAFIQLVECLRNFEEVDKALGGMCVR